MRLRATGRIHGVSCRLPCRVFGRLSRPRYITIVVQARHDQWHTRFPDSTETRTPSPRPSRGDHRLPLRQAPPGLRQQPEQPDPGDEFESMSLEDIVTKSSGGIFNNARPGVEPHVLLELPVAERRRRAQGRAGRRHQQGLRLVDEFKKKFSASAVGNFGSGWTWLVKNADGFGRADEHVQRRHADDIWQEGAADDRRVGARLLHRLTATCGEVPRRDLEADTDSGVGVRLIPAVRASPRPSGHSGVVAGPASRGVRASPRAAPSNDSGSTRPPRKASSLLSISRAKLLARDAIVTRRAPSDGAGSESSPETLADHQASSASVAGHRDVRAGQGFLDERPNLVAVH